MVTAAPADLVIRNANVFTAADGDDSLYAGFAVTAGEFVAVCAAEEELDAHIGPDTEVQDLDGAFVLPGLFDAHCHLQPSALRELRELTFPSHATMDEALAAVDAFAVALPAGAWVSGGSWGSTLRPEISTLEARARLDAVSHGHPVHLYDDSGHNAWVNSEAMRLSGLAIDGSGEHPEGTLTDPETGELLGVLLERATAPVRTYLAKADAPTREERLRATRAGMRTLHSFGITSIMDALVLEEDLIASSALDRAGELKLHISCCVFNTGPNREGFNYEAARKLGDEVASDLLRTDFIKLALDGVPPAQTGAFIDPYLPSEEWGAEHHGQVTMTPDELAEVLRHNCRNGWSTKIHCTGDASVRAAIDGYEAMRKEGFTDVKLHVAHSQFVTPEDRARMADLDIVAEISPFLWYPGVIVEAIRTVVGDERTDHMHPNRDLVDRGVLVAAGSDWPVMPPNPWHGIEGLVTRADPTGRHPGELWREQALSVPEALRVFSINGAKAAGWEDEVGSIEVGKCADFAVIDRDPLSIDPADIADTQVLSTWFAGEQVYSRDAAAEDDSPRTTSSRSRPTPATSS